MTLQDVFEYLTFGELQSVVLGNSQEQEISPEHYRNVIAHVNLALKEIYKRFWLSSKQFYLQLYPHIYDYELDKKYAITNITSPEIYKYIIDSAESPFINDLLKIEQVFNQDAEELSLNDLTQDLSLFTPTYKTIQTPPVFKANYTDSFIIVHYRAAHENIIYTSGMNPANIEIFIPDGLLEALLAYIGYRAQVAIGGPEAQQEAMLYQQRFEISCDKARERGMEVTTNYTNTKLDTNGWV